METTSVRSQCHRRRWRGRSLNLKISANGFKLAKEQLCACRWLGEAMDVALQEEENEVLLPERTQHACLLIGAGGTGKTTIILELMLDVFCHFFLPDLGKKKGI